MRYASFLRPDGSATFGRVDGETIVDLATPRVPDLKTAIATGTLATLAAGPAHALDAVKLLPLIPNPGKILCVGLNYETHRLETGRDAAAHPAIFTRFADTLIAAGDPIVRPAISTKLDYEGELAIVIGKGGRAIARENALDHIAGYSIFNDASIRDWQKHNIQFTPGKNFPGTGAFGPYLFTPDEISDLPAHRVVTRLNDQVVQDQAISEMIWPIDEIIAYLSAFTPLSPGDVIATGTPGGVGAKRTPPLWMKPGDTVTVTIGSLGILSNPIGEEG